MRVAWLISAQVVEGRRLTAWKTVQDDLRQIPGVTVVDEEVVVDGNLVNLSSARRSGRLRLGVAGGARQGALRRPMTAAEPQGPSRPGQLPGWEDPVLPDPQPAPAPLPAPGDDPGGLPDPAPGLAPGPMPAPQPVTM